MAFFVENTTTEHEITDPVTGEKASVTIRKLNAGDTAAIQDTIRMTLGEKPDAEFKLGEFRLLMVERALVAWSLPKPVTPMTIRALEPDVFEQIFNIVNQQGTDNNPLDDES
jgi:hypothetical protein